MENFLPSSVKIIWNDLSNLLIALDEIQNRLDPGKLDKFKEKFSPLRNSLENSYSELKKTDSLERDILEDILIISSEYALDGLNKFLSLNASPNELMKMFQALIPFIKSKETIYPLSTKYEEVSEFFLHSVKKNDINFNKNFINAEQSDSQTIKKGIIDFNNSREQRGGYSLYVPEYYSNEKKWPLIVALHGGYGHGADFFWSWLKEARSFGFILASPTSLKRTWSFNSPQVDANQLNKMLSEISSTWNIDTKHILLTGLSDGGTFSMILSVVHQSPFTHYAPVASAIHALIDRSGEVKAPVKGLNVYQVHGIRDWMFPVEKARSAYEAMELAGANIVYKEIPDLSHNYPQDENINILEWFYGK